jgi:trk system potassium uptake protein
MLFSSEKLFLFTFFIILILAGTAALMLPLMWTGAESISFIDSLFTATSAVCVTGLITLDTAMFSQTGKIVIMLLIQFGGLGIISFSTIYLTIPNKKKPFRSVNIIRGYYLDSVGHDALKIIRNIIVFTLFFEIAGAFILFYSFKGEGNLLNALFHSVSAFCNAGFSLFTENLEGQKDNIPVLFTIMLLIITGGIGFVVINDLLRFILKRKPLSAYSKLVLVTTLILIAAGTAGYYFFERENTFLKLPEHLRIFNAMFQSVTTRTAGFNTVSQIEMHPASSIITLPLMFIGGGSGSIAGGVKVSTVAIIFIALFRGRNRKNNIRIGNRNVKYKVIIDAFILTGKAALLLFTSVVLLLMIEGSNFPVVSIVFESFSAFGTVGLSHGITPYLSSAGKLIMIITMFAGRIGIITMALPNESKFKDVQVNYPEEEVLLG